MPLDPAANPIKVHPDIVEKTNLDDLKAAKSESVALQLFLQKKLYLQTILAATAQQEHLKQYRSIFVALSEKDTVKHSVPSVMKQWSKLEDRFLFPSKQEGGAVVVNPALMTVARDNYVKLQPWLEGYKKLDMELGGIQSQLATLHHLKTVAAEIHAYMHEKLSLMKFRELDEKTQTEWRHLMANLQHEIALREQFIKNREHAEKVNTMFATVLEFAMNVDPSDPAFGVYRPTRYKEIVTPIDFKDTKRGTPEEQVSKSLQAMQMDEKADIPADIAERNPLHYTATPSHVQTVAVHYAKADKMGDSVVGKHTEFYRQEATALHRCISQIKIDVSPKDPTALARQMVDVATKYYLNCEKDEIGQPKKPIQLNGLHPKELCVALVCLGVNPKMIELTGGMPTIDNIKDNEQYAAVAKIANKQRAEFSQLIKQTPQPSMLKRVLGRNAKVAHEIQSHADAKPESSPALLQLQMETVNADGNLRKVAKAPMFIPDFDQAEFEKFKKRAEEPAEENSDDPESDNGFSLNN